MRTTAPLYWSKLAALQAV